MRTKATVPLHAAVGIEIEAAPESVYALISDLPRTPRWSVECYRVEWRHGQPGEVGSTWHGWNRVGNGPTWERDGVVDQAEPGRVFAFRTIGGRGLSNDSTRWTYTITPTAKGCRLIQAYQLLIPPSRIATMLIRRYLPSHRDRSPDLRITMDRIKIIAEDELPAPY